MRRELILNWCEEHEALGAAVEAAVEDPREVGTTGIGWTYLTFCRPGTLPSDVLYDVDRLGAIARENGFFLPIEIVSQHNKVVVAATGVAGSSGHLFALMRFLQSWAKQFQDATRFPHHGFYGKLGGVYEREEKGRALAMYAVGGDDALLEVNESAERIAREVRVPGVSLSVRLSNGLSAIPRMLDGFGDPEYRKTGATYYRITDPAAFAVLIEQARQDYPKYPFATPR